jgi:hypothetical protein
MPCINCLKLSLVAGTSTRVPPHANQADATSTATMPEGWFCEEVGYVGETTGDARALTLAGPPRLD